jgi:hypothetical protein
MKWRHRKDRGKPQGENDADEPVAPKEDVHAGYETAAMSMDYADEVEQQRRDAKDRAAKPVPQDEPLKDQGDALDPYGENWSDQS